MHGSGLVATSETHVVVLAVDGDVLKMTLLKLLDGVLNGGETLAGGTHELGGIVGVATSTVPVTLEGLGVERRLDAPLLTDAEKEETSHPEVVAELDALARTDLELPLGGHDLGVDTRDLDTSVETSTLLRKQTMKERDSRMDRRRCGLLT